MKKTLFICNFIKVFYLLIFTGTFCKIPAQTPAQTPTQKPFMWGPKDEGLSQIENFKTLKLRQMSKNAGLTVSLLNDKLLLGNFWGMIRYFDKTYEDDFQYLHIYLGINSSKKIVFIFAPATSESQSSDLKWYYLPKNFNPAEPQNFVVSIGDKDSWTKNFIKAMALNTIGINHPDNQFPSDSDVHKVSSDTRFATYCANDIRELMFVKDYYSSQGFDIGNSMNGFLGCYLLNGVPRGRLKGRFVNRIVIQFDFLDSSNKEFYLDIIKEFKKLPEAEASNCMNLIDNGQLCPTYCPR